MKAEKLDKALKVGVTVLAATTVLQLGNDIVPHTIQMLVLSAGVIYCLWLKKG